ncbi:MAG: hypothetical protein RQ826_08510 [Xanthomonadales bacterium]|nr:hypothetical protein [Xanthomonadales bacterium]
MYLLSGAAALSFAFGDLPEGIDIVVVMLINIAYQIIQTSIAWAIAAIPEGLPIVASIALARGMLRLADHDVIVKRLVSVETPSETNTIFTD